MKYTAEATAVFLCQICLVLHLICINLVPLLLPNIAAVIIYIPKLV